jgi:putative membrane protein
LKARESREIKKFGLVNALMLLLTGWIADQFGLGFHVLGFMPALISALVVSAVSFVLNLVAAEATGQEMA